MSDTTTDYNPVKYVRNADQTSSNGAIAFNDDSRPDLPIGGIGLVTAEERDRLGFWGFVLEDDDVENVPADVMRAVYGDDEEDLDKLTKPQLQDRLDQLGVSYSQSTSKPDLIDLVKSAGTSDAEGAESLPATVPVGGTGGASAPTGQSGTVGGTPGGGTAAAGTATTGAGA